MQYFINLLKTSKTQLGISLTIIFITAFLNNPSQKALLVFLVSLISTAIADLLFLRIRRIPLFFPSAALVTGSIIGLLTSPNFDWYIPIVIGIIAMFSKNFIRFSNRHIFNPAGFGLLVGAIIFHNNVSWWAVSFQRLNIYSLPSIFYFLILLSPALITAIRMQRWRMTLSFLMIYVFLNQFLNLKSSILNLITDPTILFFSLVMLPEPMTTPNRHIRQILFGTFVAIISLVVSSPILNSFDPLIFALLLGNLVFFRFR